jgi:hypothetical protein
MNLPFPSDNARAGPAGNPQVPGSIEMWVVSGNAKGSRRWWLGVTLTTTYTSALQSVVSSALG